MCRIAGIACTKLTIHERERMVKAMCDIQWRGGPDDEGVYSPETSVVTLGNRRLSFNDLSVAGHQPMLYKNRYSITFNGEIYNFQDIRNELIKSGFEFNSHSDTEVILAAYAAWGKSSFHMLEGMFAFALYDNEQNTVTLVRDPSGIKPLYYSIHEGRMVFASEVRAFKSIPLNWEDDKNWPVYLMAFGHIPEPFTIYKEVKTLPKGNQLTYHIDSNRIEQESFFTYSFSASSKSISDPAGWVKSTLENAVEKQLLADVPVGVFLSGGIDSSILSLIASKEKNIDLHTLSICFDEEKYSEKKYQDLVFQKLNGTKHRLLLNKHEFQQHLPKVLDDMDLPSADGINSWFISKYTREQGVKGVLSGIGADELFGGYPSFDRINKLEWIRKFPNWINQLISTIPGKRSRRLPYLQLNGMVGSYLFLRGHFGIREIAHNLNTDEKEVEMILNEYGNHLMPETLAGKNKAGWMEFNMYMQNQLLRDADAMSMAHGVEIRVPFLDHNLVKGLFSMPEDQKYKKGIPKQLLVDAFEDVLPEAIWNRKKMGFSFPFSEWLKNNETVNQLMAKNTEIGKERIASFEKGEMPWSCFLILMLLKKNDKI
jgi:asparagine synthase (glutamine-hydrolysing)